MIVLFFSVYYLPYCITLHMHTHFTFLAGNNKTIKNNLIFNEMERNNPLASTYSPYFFQ